MPTPTRKSATASEAKNALVLVRRGRLRPTSNIVKQETLWLLSEAISSYRHNGKNPANNPKPGVSPYYDYFILAAINTPNEKMKAPARTCSDFIYCCTDLCIYITQ